MKTLTTRSQEGQEAPARPRGLRAKWAAADLDELKLSPEVAWYLESRGYRPPNCPPLIKTPEPRDVEGAVFDGARVDHVIGAFRKLRHTKGRFAGQAFEPDCWQVAYYLAPVFGWVHVSSDTGEFARIITTAWVELPRKNGKGIDVRTPLLTGRGWIKFGDVRVGDLVHAIDGEQVPVTFVSDEHDLDCYEVTFSDGQTIICDEQHLWTAWDRYGHDPVRWADHQGKGAEVTIDTPTLFQQHRCGRRGDTRYSVRTDRVLMRPKADLPIPPYLLGAWLGDGSTDGAVIHGIDEPILDRFRAAGYQLVHRGRCSWGIKPGFYVALRDAGVLGDKHVSDSYLLASAEQRLELLRGLMDTDGGVNTGPNTPRVEFANTKKPLADAVLFLARSLGWKATIREGRARLNGRDCGPVWRVAWTAYRDRSPFYLQRKTEQLAWSPLQTTRSCTLTITGVRRVPSVPTRCIQVDHPARQFLVGEGLVPTHNTTTAGGTGIYLTGADGESGAQVVCAATNKDQARFAFDPMKHIVRRSPELQKHFTAFQSKIVHQASGSYFMPVANVGDAQHGADVHGAIVDEVHLHKDMELIEALETGTGSRIQPLILYITTADAGKRHTPYDEKRTRVDKLAAGVLHDPTTYGVVFGAEPTDDPFLEATWKKANPGYGISPTRRALQSAATKAKDSPSELASFLRLHLNIRTKQQSRFFTMDSWDRNAADVDPASLAGGLCYGGLDLGSTSDLTALCWVFPSGDWGAFDVVLRCWAPEDSLGSLDDRTARAASVWVREGWLTTTPGNVTDYDFIKSQIAIDRDLYLVQEIAYDRWNATQLVNDLVSDGAPMVTMGQGFASMSAPTKDLQRLVLTGTKERPVIRHGGNPLLRWMVDNFAVAMDPAGNVKPDKANAGDKIDGVVALIMALSRALSCQPPATEVWGFYD